MQFKKLSGEDIEYFKSVVGNDSVYTDEEALSIAARDETEDLYLMPEAVLQPDRVEQISMIMAYCNEHMIAVTPRGGGTGLSGGALALHGGVVLDMKKFDKIINIDTENFQVTTEPGVITQVLQEELQKRGLFYPPDPSSKGTCFIGGNVAENSGGPKAVKYGVVKDYVLNMEVVLPDGSVIWTGANVLKNATGYNLTQLFVGSEGTLGVVTKIVLKLIPAVKYDMLILVPFRKSDEACKAVNAIMLDGVTPSALEFMERDALDWVMKYANVSSIHVSDDIQAHLLIEVDGNDIDVLMKEMEQIAAVLEQYDTGEVLFADTHAQKEMLWQLRRKVGEAVKSNSIYKEEDTVVPRAKLPELLATVKRIGKEYGFKSVCYGHAGDGNLHVNIVKTNMSDDDWNNKLTEGIRILFAEVVKMGGTISGEHGIGLVQKGYMDIAFSQKQLDLMKSIKNIFDPKGILNPGKMF